MRCLDARKPTRRDGPKTGGLADTDPTLRTTFGCGPMRAPARILCNVKRRIRSLGQVRKCITTVSSGNPTAYRHHQLGAIFAAKRCTPQAISETRTNAFSIDEACMRQEQHEFVAAEAAQCIHAAQM